MVFQKRDLLQTATLGERLRHIREETGRSVDDIAATIAIQSKYLSALEEGNYRVLPGPVYARSFVKKYAIELGVDLGAVMDLFDKEYNIVTSGRVDRHLPPERVSTDHHWLRRHGRFVLAGTVVGLVLIYLGIQVVRLISPPPLTVVSPAGNISTHEQRITVTGATDPTAGVTINNQAVDLNDQGNFAEPIDLAIGLNTLRIVAVKRHSQKTTIIRQVLVESK